MPVTPPDPTDWTLPTDTSLAEQGQAELRAIKAYMQGALTYAIQGGVVSMPGDIIWSAAPTRVGCLPANGQAISRTDYAALFAAIGISCGPGDGATTFNVPDIKGRTVFGYDAGNATGRLTGGSTGGISAATVGNVGGTQNHSLSVTELANHNHTVTSSVVDPTHTHTWVGNAHAHTYTDPSHVHAYAAVTNTPGPALAAGTGATSVLANTAGTAVGITINNTTVTGGNVAAATGIVVNSSATAVGSGTAFNTVPPGIVLYPYVKT